MVGDLQVMLIQTRGFQECPWECEDEYSWGSLDFVMLNRKTGGILKSPGMIVHLLREHQFFEGEERPYRVDPAQVARVTMNNP